MPRRGADQPGELLLRHHLVEGPGLEIELRMGACDPVERVGEPRPATIPTAFNRGSSPARIAAVWAPSE